MFGKKLKRGEMILDHGAVTASLRTFAETHSNLQLLRIYWYDGTSQGPSSQHISTPHRNACSEAPFCVCSRLD